MNHQLDATVGDSGEAARIAELERIDAELSAAARRLGISREALLALMSNGAHAVPAIDRVEFLA